MRKRKRTESIEEYERFLREMGASPDQRAQYLQQAATGLLAQRAGKSKRAAARKTTARKRNKRRRRF